MNRDLSNSLGEIAQCAIEIGDPVQSIYTKNWTGLLIARGGTDIYIRPSSTSGKLEFLYEFTISGAIEVTEDEVASQIENIPGDVSESEIEQDIQEKRYEKIDQEQIENIEADVEDRIAIADSIINKNTLARRNSSSMVLKH